MLTASAPVGEPDFVEAELNYLKPGQGRPVNYVTTPPPGVPQRTGEIEARQVRIRNARQLDVTPSLDVQGFQLVRHTTAVTDFKNEELVRSTYYAEVSEVLRRVTGAVKVVTFDHTLRFALPGHQESGVREAVNRVHDDQTFHSGPRRVRDHLPAEEAEARLKKRHAIINFWRPIGSAVQSWPLAVCDARSISTEDLVASDLVYPDKVGETYSVLHNADHRWFYYPELVPDEVLLLKIFDSRDDGVARLTAHTAFVDPSSRPDAPPRRSIEVRSLVFWD